MTHPVGRLKRRADFLRVAGARRKWAARGLVLQVAPRMNVVDMAKRRGEDEAALRVGFTVTRKVGNAVVRNRVRRRLKSVVAETFPLFARGGHDYVVIGRQAALNRPYDALRADLEQALRKLGMWCACAADGTDGLGSAKRR